MTIVPYRQQRLNITVIRSFDPVRRPACQLPATATTFHPAFVAFVVGTKKGYTFLFPMKGGILV